MRESSVHGLTLGDVACACDCSPSWMYKIVERKVSASIDLLPALARVLRIELHELLLPAAHA